MHSREMFDVLSRGCGLFGMAPGGFSVPSSFRRPSSLAICFALSSAVSTTSRALSASVFSFSCSVACSESFAPVVSGT